MSLKPLILVTNDDGITASGIRSLVKIMNLILEVMGNIYQSRDFDTVGKLCLKIDLQFCAIDLCSS